MAIKNGEYEKYSEVFPDGSKVRCELEWKPGKWNYGTVSYHHGHWMFIELEDGTLTEYDYRYLDVEDSRNSLVRLAS